MGYWVNAFKKSVLDHVTAGGSALSQPSTVQVALFTTVPSEAGAGGVEASGSGYARQNVSFGAATNADPSVAANGATVTFSASGGDISGLNGWGIYLDGTLAFVDEFASPITIADGTSKEFAIGALTVSSN